ncbi:cardiolipin synthase [Salegentibacter salegens]|uniref:Cardiolipin synthase n=1 Tax=Salegentibacter salegens TaxID=143223 RepID=A0A1M7JFW5_9FLAO|nr:cardiolipin synthase [Salegentibacter salegens]PRX42902.1 cardiolipin synthase [Salegentibacter salegens]SHM51912.1 cardiolipin synthase [Salegentibacter salegens]
MNVFLDNFWWVLLSVNFLIVFITAGYELMHFREPVKSISLIFALFVLPVIGLLVYYFFAQEFRKSKLFNRKKLYDQKIIQHWEDKLILKDQDLIDLDQDCIAQKIKLVHLLQNNQKKPVTFKNKASVLINGENKFSALFNDIKKAQHHIHIEYYIFNSGRIGNRLILLLCEKAEEGVKIRVSYDYVASRLSSKAVKKMKSCGIEIFPFMPVWFPNLTRKLNYRNHRKMAIIDGNIGFIGGINICDEYVNFEENPKEKLFWRDTHLRIEGHAVKSLQAQFLLNFNFISGKELKVEDEFFPKIDIPQRTAVQIAASGPDTDWQNIMEAILTAINTADKYIYITTPYFIPNNQILTALCMASRIGVEVKIIIPEKGDSVIARYATNSYIEKLLESGVQVFHYHKGMVHAKTMVVDGVLTSIGSCNLDNRSFDINFEINAFLYDKEVAEEMTEVYKNDLKETTKLTIEEWMQRPALEKIREALARLWAPLL